VDKLGFGLCVLCILPAGIFMLLLILSKVSEKDNLALVERSAPIFQGLESPGEGGWMKFENHNFSHYGGHLYFTLTGFFKVECDLDELDKWYVIIPEHGKVIIDKNLLEVESSTPFV